MTMQISGLCGSVGRSKFAQITYGSAAIEEFVAQMLSVRLTTSTLLAQVLQNKGMIKYRAASLFLTAANSKHARANATTSCATRGASNEAV